MLVDNFSRRFTYLRLSVTEACNFRCNYCLPQGTDCSTSKRAQELTLPEIENLVRAFARLGTRKIRITGGEPSLRHDLTEIIALCKSIPDIETVALTTNGYRLQQDLPAWKAAGLDTLNVSIDSLDAARFEMITGHAKLHKILEGLTLASQLGIQQIKINAVLMRGFNDEALEDFMKFVRSRALTLRFIELMQTNDNLEFFQRHHLSGQHLIERLLAQGWQELPRELHAGPAREFYHADYRGRIGLIMPYSKDFCGSCNRLRVSSTGQLFLCLFADEHQHLRDLLQRPADQQKLMDYLSKAVAGKAASHSLHDHKPGATRHLAMIGG
jgi:cyclic pyranopterin phosphate synthase